MQKESLRSILFEMETPVGGSSSVTFEILNLALVFFGSFS